MSSIPKRDNNHEIQRTVSPVKYSWTLQGRVESNFLNFKSDENIALNRFPINYRDKIHEVNTHVATKWGIFLVRV